MLVVSSSLALCSLVLSYCCLLATLCSCCVHLLLCRLTLSCHVHYLLLVVSVIRCLPNCFVPSPSCPLFVASLRSFAVVSCPLFVATSLCPFALSIIRCFVACLIASSIIRCFALFLCRRVVSAICCHIVVSIRFVHYLLLRFVPSPSCRVRYSLLHHRVHSLRPLFVALLPA